MRCSCSSDRLWVGLLFPPFATLSVFGVFFRQGSVERALEDINTATWEIRLIFPFRIFILE